jgi:DNA polymerase-3 subunit delta'
MNNYQIQWEYLQLAWQKGRTPPAMLFSGAFNPSLKSFIVQYTQLVFCRNNESKPCQLCIDCQMAAQVQHPDEIWVKPEKFGGSIKIDQIRELQNYIYLMPQRAKHQIIIITAADRLNSSAANALLKILEEPAKHTLFLLLAEQLGTVLPTVLSRCQILRFPPKNDLSVNFLTLADQYPEETEYSVLINQAEPILDGLIDIMEEKIHPCVMAAQWMHFELNTFLWFIYWVYAQVQMMLIQHQSVTGPAANQFKKLASLLNPVSVFAQIDKINSLKRKLNHNQNVNHALALEHLLFSLQEDRYGKNSTNKLCP